MTSIQKAQLEFLNETVEFYTINDRCVDPLGCCKYYLPNKPGCAIGRKITDVKLRKSLDKNREGGTNVENSVIFNLLPEELRELGQNFLSAIQWLHDCEPFWSKSKKGLTDSGQQYVNETKIKFGLI